MNVIYNWIRQLFYQCMPQAYIDNSDNIINTQSLKHHIIDIDKKDYNLLTPNMLKQGIVSICKQN